MIRFLLFFLVVLFSGFYTKAQQPKAREIVDLALKKHTSGVVLERYEIKAEYLNPGKTPSYLYQRDELLLMMDSVFKTMPDSIQTKIALQMADLNEKNYLDILEQYIDDKQWFYVDLKAGKMSQTQVKPNPLNGNIDSVRTSKKIEDEYLFRNMLKMNPVALLQLMGGQYEINYVGTSNIDSHDYFIVQVKIKGKWLDVYIDQTNYVVSHVSEDMVDNDPVIGVGPDYSKRLVFYHDYHMKGPFLLPDALEEVASHSDNTIRKTIDWISTNKPIPDSLFEAKIFNNPQIEIRYEEVYPDLFVEKTSERWINNRSLIRRNGNNTLDIFTSLPNKAAYIDREIESIKVRFSGLTINNIYTVSPLYEVGSFNNIFKEKIHITGPQGKGFLSEARIQRNYYQNEAWIKALKYGGITTFGKKFETNNVMALVLNTDSSVELNELNVAYYLPKEKLIYVSGKEHQTDSHKALKIDRDLLETIKSQQIKVDRIIYSEAFNNTAPLFITFQDFETRIKNTDFSIYDNVKR